MQRGVREVVIGLSTIGPVSGPIVLITIYSKTEQSDITPAEIRRIISECEPQCLFTEERVTETEDH